MLSKKVALASGAVVGLLLAAVSTAWACTAVAHRFALSAVDGPAGAQIEAQGEAVASKGPVEIRWNSATGDVLATTTDLAAFSAPMKIPNVSPGVYYLVAVADGQAVARAAFEVTGTSVASSPGPSLAWNDLGTKSVTSAGQGPSSGLSSQVMAGVALLAVGGVALLSGTALVATRRRRVPVSID